MFEALLEISAFLYFFEEHSVSEFETNDYDDEEDGIDKEDADDVNFDEQDRMLKNLVSV